MNLAEEPEHRIAKKGGQRTISIGRSLLKKLRSFQLSDRSQRLHCHGSDDGSSRTVAVPVCVISKAFAAASDKSMIRLSIKGPRSLIFTSTDFPLARFVTFILVPNGRV